MAIQADILLILLFSVIGGVLAVRLMQPSMLGLLVIGAAVGPANLGIIKDVSLLETSIEVGAVLLLFTIGLEFSLGSLFNKGLAAVSIATAKLGIVFAAGYFAGILLGLGLIPSLYAGIILSITSTVIVVKILEQKGLYKREELPLLVAVLVIEDLFAVFALTFFSGMANPAEFSLFSAAAKILLSIVMLILVYVVLRKLMNSAVGWLARYSAEETSTFAALGICAGMSYIAYFLGLSPSVGAFLAGSIVAASPSSSAFKKAIHPFILTFTSLFFFSVGTVINFSSLADNFWIVVVLLLVSLAAKFLAVAGASYLFANFNGRQAVFSGVAMVSVGEFSLLIAREASVISPALDLLSITAAIIVLSSLAMALLVSNTEPLYALLKRLIPARIALEMRGTSSFVKETATAVLGQNSSYRKIAGECRNILINLAAIIFVMAVSAALWSVFRSQLPPGVRWSVIAVAAAAVILLALIPAFRILSNIRNLRKDILLVMKREHPETAADEGRLLAILPVMLAVFCAIVAVPIVETIAGFHPFYYLVQAFFIVILSLLIYQSMRLIEHIRGRKSG